MRYITDSNGYLLEVSFGAIIKYDDTTCTEYTGGVPSGYDSLMAWFAKEGDKLYRWHIVGGQLTLDSNVTAQSVPSVVFAPAGYGLGDVCVEIDDWDNVVADGFCTGTVNTVDGQRWWGFTIARSENYLEQRAFRSPSGVMRETHRSKYNGTWQPWEWVNPPMAYGVEYRTTERYNSKPVYTKCIDFGTMPNNGTANVSTGVTNVTYIDHTMRIVDGAGEVSNGTALYSYGEVIAHSWIGANVCSIRALTDCSDCHAYITIKYTKN